MGLRVLSPFAAVVLAFVGVLSLSLVIRHAIALAPPDVVSDSSAPNSPAPTLKAAARPAQDDTDLHSDPPLKTFSRTYSQIPDRPYVIAASIPVRQVWIEGNSYGYVDRSYMFTATVVPTDASPPIRYLWSPDPMKGLRRPNAEYSWPSPGRKVITVTVSSKIRSQVITHIATHTIDVIGEPIPVQRVEILCPDTVYYNETDTLTTAIIPTNASVPIDYLWSPSPDSGQHTANATYRWGSLGILAVTVAASNTIYYPPAIDSCQLTIMSVPIGQVSIAGTDTITAHQPTVFNALVSPVSATRPITYTWSPTPLVGQFSSSAIYSFSNPGDVTITVVAENITNAKVSNPHRARVVPGKPPTRVYAPVLLKRWPPIPDIPYLYPISNPSGGHNYTVTWSTADLAETYVLQEDFTAQFNLLPVEVCSGSQNYCSLNDQGAGRYYYRVKACNAWGCSEWSNVQSVDVLWESDSNDNIAQSDGPLVSDIKYYGRPEDDWDFFYFLTHDRGQISVDLSNHVGQGVQLLLYYQSSENLVCRDYDSLYHLDCSGNAGQYYIGIYAEGGFSNTASYTLTTTFPQSLWP